jgi:type III secretory pathway component EscU
MNAKSFSIMGKSALLSTPVIFVLATMTMNLMAALGLVVTVIAVADWAFEKANSMRRVWRAKLYQGKL